MDNTELYFSPEGLKAKEKLTQIFSEGRITLDELLFLHEHLVRMEVKKVEDKVEQGRQYTPIPHQPEWVYPRQVQPFIHQPYTTGGPFELSELLRWNSGTGTTSSASAVSSGSNLASNNGTYAVSLAAN